MLVNAAGSREGEDRSVGQAPVAAAAAVVAAAAAAAAAAIAETIVEVRWRLVLRLALLVSNLVE